MLCSGVQLYESLQRKYWQTNPMHTFAGNLLKRILDAQFAELVDNHDQIRFGREKKLKGLREFLRRQFRNLGFYRRDYLWPRNQQRKLELWSPHFPALENLFILLDEASRSLLVDVVAYRIMGHRHIRLPISSPKYHSNQQRVLATADMTSKLPTQVGGFDLVLHNLKMLGWDIKLYMPPGGPLTTYIIEQYAQPQHGIRVRQGDVVLDCGGCWGDTALYFAHLAGKTGRVLSFEFMEENLNIFRKNLVLNPALANRIEIVEQPLWSRPNLHMTFSQSGPAAYVAESARSDGTHKSISIDDAVVNWRLDRVDFIKMDIEGAEFEALQGARETIIRHRPDLALCVYHSTEDFTRLAEFVDTLGLGYRFHFGHFTIHQEESVLFATAR